MSIITKNGDCGMTDLIGERICKTDCRLELIGPVDEAISLLSIVGAFLSEKNRHIEEITMCQEALFRFNSQIAGAKVLDLTKFTEYFEDFVSKNEPEQFRFSFTSSKIASIVDYTRCVMRRAERCFFKLEVQREDLKMFINRISDYLYVLSRTIESEEIKC